MWWRINETLFRKWAIVRVLLHTLFNDTVYVSAWHLLDLNTSFTDAPRHQVLVAERNVSSQYSLSVSFDYSRHIITIFSHQVPRQTDQNRRGSWRWSRWQNSVFVSCQSQWGQVNVWTFVLRRRTTLRFAFVVVKPNFEATKKVISALRWQARMNLNTHLEWKDMGSQRAWWPPN